MWNHLILFTEIFQSSTKEKNSFENKKKNRWIKLQVLFQFNLANYRSRKIISVLEFSSTEADFCAPDCSPRKGFFGLIASTRWTDKQFISLKVVFWIKRKPIIFGYSLQPTFKTELFSILTSLIYIFYFILWLLTKF